MMTRVPQIRLRNLWIPALLIACVALIYAKNIFSNLILARGDIYLYFYPYWHAAAAALQTGRLPLWNPDLFMGAPFLANSQVGLFYPLNWPLWLLLETPYAVSVSIVTHVLIAGLGTYWATRRALNASRTAALLAALLFALGGFFTAQVEHINQAQALAWLPWLLGVATGWEMVSAEWRSLLRKLLAIAILFALQLAAGHAQAVFISGVALLLWSALQLAVRRGAWGKAAVLTALVIVGGVLLAALLVAVQLMPLLELTRLSLRQGGLSTNEALSFSLHPLLAARALLPGYGQTSYVEYVAYLPLVALVLAVVGAWQWRTNRAVVAPLGLAVVGLFLALGAANPLYRYGLIHVPGFDLFRVPARWLTLYALGAALLAAAGWDWLMARGWRITGRDRRPIAAGLLVCVGLIGMAWVSVVLSQWVLMPPESPAEWPNALSLAGWGVELALLFLLLWQPFGRLPATPYILFAIVIISLFVASRVLSAYDTTTPEAYFDVRPSVARLQADAIADRAAGHPPGRYLSMSLGLFDPGDQAEIDTIYADQLSQQARERYTTTVKQREIIVPNLSLVYGLSAVDGFDGGVLPSADFAAVADLLLPPDADTVDGRLRESIDVVPDARWLDLFGVRYLITDKVGDQWLRHDDIEVFFDLQHRVVLQSGESATVGYVPHFEATELWIVSEGEPGDVIIETSSHSQQNTIEQIDDNLYRVRWDAPVVPSAIVLAQPDDAATPWTIAGLALVDGRDGAFQPLTPGNHRLIHSGDVKVYENLDVLPRAFMVSEAVSAETTTDAVDLMRDPGFDPRRAVVLTDHEPLNFGAVDGAVDIVDYAAERVVISAESSSGGILVLTDAYYPGWRATIDGEPTPIIKANGLFRAVILPPGMHEIVFTIQLHPSGRIITIVSFTLLLVAAVALIASGTGKRKRPA
ncbi:MAG: YfhO family protein [Anaerolineae bacterium]|nr:YfhO family protein [Anaerolineae bacterium]